MYMQELEEGQPQQGGINEMSRATTTKEQRSPYCPYCNGQGEGVVHLNDDPIQDNVTRVAPVQQGETATQMQTQRSQPHTSHTACANENEPECVSPDDTFYCSPEFLEQLDHLESIAREQIQQRKRVACSPPSFSLGISLEKEATAAPSAYTTPTTNQFKLGENIVAREPPVGSEQPTNPEKSPKTTKGTHKAEEKHEIKKAKQVVLWQQPKKDGKKIIVLDNRLARENPTSRYKHCVMAMAKIPQTQNS
ncbi:hypothetical protein Cgig2_003292 [Carnegiea gigantea]|uniref:Uncharacterized protein n=1 Tax=Carnegiea gigantea TaxID=171969 RepID=A0A9Q1JQ70_9CARY|nr:hypothetical protein Cgig2_003292 [Carnegiea gigantea]